MRNKLLKNAEENGPIGPIKLGCQTQDPGA